MLFVDRIYKIFGMVILLPISIFLSSHSHLLNLTTYVTYGVVFFSVVFAWEFSNFSNFRSKLKNMQGNINSLDCVSRGYLDILILRESLSVSYFTVSFIVSILLMFVVSSETIILSMILSLVLHIFQVISVGLVIADVYLAKTHPARRNNI